MVHHHLLLFPLLLQGKEKFLAILNKYMEIHGTVYYESQRPPEVPAFVKNHGLLPQPEFQQLLRKAKVRLWPLSYPCRPQPWMTGVYQAGHLHVLCCPESWQTLVQKAGRPSQEGLGEWGLSPVSLSRVLGLWRDWEAAEDSHTGWGYPAGSPQCC